MDADAGEKSLVKVIDPAPRQLPSPEAVARALDVIKSAERPLIILGVGCRQSPCVGPALRASPGWPSRCATDAGRHS